MAENNELSLSGFGLRVLFAMLLVFLTVNPAGISYYHWIIAGDGGMLALKLLCGVVLLAGWAIYLVATRNSLGWPGTLLITLFFIALFWLLIDWGLLRANSTSAMAWLAEIVLVAVLSVGISWSHIQRRLSGQVDTDEIEG